MAHDEVISSIKFDDRGLVPAIAQQFDSGEVLMMAWMNADSVSKRSIPGAYAIGRVHANHFGERVKPQAKPNL